MLVWSHSCETDTNAATQYHGIAKHMDLSHTVMGVAERDANCPKPWQLRKPFGDAAMRLHAVRCLGIEFAAVEP